MTTILGLAGLAVLAFDAWMTHKREMAELELKLAEQREREKAWTPFFDENGKPKAVAVPSWPAKVDWGDRGRFPTPTAEGFSAKMPGGGE